MPSVALKTLKAMILQSGFVKTARALLSKARKETGVTYCLATIFSLLDKSQIRKFGKLSGLAPAF